MALLKLDATAEALTPPAVRTDAVGRLDPTSVPDLLRRVRPGEEGGGDPATNASGPQPDATSYENLT